MSKIVKIFLIIFWGFSLSLFFSLKYAFALVPGGPGPSRLPEYQAGASCANDLECAKGLACIAQKCASPTTSSATECVDDSGCPDTFCLNAGAGEKRFCASYKLVTGNRCDRNEQCFSDLCSNNKCQINEKKYVPLEPKLQIPIPNLSFSQVLPVEKDGQTVLYIPFIAEYLAGLYKYLIAIVGIFAGVMISYAGIKWMLASGSPDKISEAKQKIGDAIMGLILAVSSYTILYLVNPNLVTFKSLRIPMVERIEDLTDGDVLEIPEGTLAMDPKALDKMSNTCVPAIKQVADYMVGLNTCVGPNHCVWFVNRTLYKAGCAVNASDVGYGPKLKRSLIAAGWKNIQGNIGDQLGSVANVAVIHKSGGHYALVIKTGTGTNKDKDFTCYESNYGGSGVTKIFTTYGGEGCSVKSTGNECKSCEQFLYEGPSPVPWSSYARRYEKILGSSKNQAFIKRPGVCGKSADFLIPPQ